MRLSLILTGLAAFGVTALESPHRKRSLLPEKIRPIKARDVPIQKRQSSLFANAKTKPYVVNGTGLPDVDFDIGESYAGTLPITSDANDLNRLWFWFFPSTNPLASKEIVIWLNGGPGCSSLDGLFQENGPFLWQPGTYEPTKNPYSWVNLTNMIWIDQPIGTGFSPFTKKGAASVTNEDVVGEQFAGFWKNFITLFSMQGYKVYIAGESYAGQYIPYIANTMLNMNDTSYYNLKGIQINDPSINHDDTLMQAPAYYYLQNNANLFGLNDTFMSQIAHKAETCGFNAFMDNALIFPPPGPIPTAPSSKPRGCLIWENIVLATLYVNPCFNFYHITDFCPFLWDELGFPSLGIGPNNYFNQSDVQKAINAPVTNYEICSSNGIFPHGDKSVPSALGPLPSVIERTNNVIIGHGMLDFLLIANGTLITINNMTWNGAQGFQTKPATGNFYVPYHQSLGQIINEVYDGSIPASTRFTDTAGAGLLGSTHTERGLTWVTVNGAGHQIPQYVPGAAYRQLEFLLGRIPSLTYVSDYTTQTGNFTGKSPLY